MMRRVLLIIVVAAIVVAVAWWVALLPGSVAIQFGGTSIDAPVPVALIGLVVLFILLYVLVRVAVFTFHLPSLSRRRRAAAHRRRGDVAVTRALVALSAHEPGDARREAARARRLLGDTPQTLLLTAYAARLAGQEDEADRAFQALASQDDAALLGLRGLLRRAISKEDWQEAAELARRAEAAHPGNTWLRAEREQLAIRTGAWKDALSVAPPGDTRIAFMIASAESDADPAQGLRLAKQAWRANKSLVPAALAYARRLRERGQENRARTVLRTTWALAPQPDLAAFALAARSEPALRLQEAGRLVQDNPQHPESLLLLARTKLETGDRAEAQRLAEAARATGLNQRRLWVLLADIAESDDSEAGRKAQYETLRHLADAEPDPVWHCDECNTPLPAWRPACPHCHTAGRVVWGTPRQALLAITE
ncbi:MAG TPA: heme biosynthesis HemY N-terminal domain-containing protein [Acetobacteraceae bacterium]|nr:heme biosynthesis HemY N-terminal domain-containing protein [Acetobacteraceae bacterium]